MNKGKGHRKYPGIILYLTLILHPLFFLNLYFYENWYSFFHDYSLGMFFGIAGYCYICASLILSSRLNFLDRYIGQDRVLRLHGMTAAAGILSGIIHLLFKISYIFGFSLQILSGISALSLFILLMFMTFLYMTEKPAFPLPGFMLFKKTFLKLMRIDYSVMKTLHNFFSLALALLIIHVVTASSTLENISRLSLITSYGLISVFSYLYFTFFRKIFPKNIFKVSSAEELCPSIIRIKIDPGAAPFRYRPGQFAYLNFKSPRIKRGEHPFSFSSSPAESEFAVTVKKAGDYTARLSSLRKGDRVFVDGPYGLFTPSFDDDQMLFIAGGIGITPFLSALRDWEIRGLSFSAVLLWSVRFENELIDTAVLERIAAGNPHFSYRIFVSGESSSVYTNGRIGEHDIKGALYSGALKDTSAYICGPLPFMSTARERLIKAGVPKRNIHMESFSS